MTSARHSTPASTPRSASASASGGPSHRRAHAARKPVIAGFAATAALVGAWYATAGAAPSTAPTPTPTTVSLSAKFPYLSAGYNNTREWTGTATAVAPNGTLGVAELALHCDDTAAGPSADSLLTDAEAYGLDARLVLERLRTQADGEPLDPPAVARALDHAGITTREVSRQPARRRLPRPPTARGPHARRSSGRGSRRRRPRARSPARPAVRVPVRP